MKFGGINKFFSSLLGGNTHSFVLRRRIVQGSNVGIHGMQTIVLRKFQGFYDTKECYKQVVGSSVVGKVGIWKSIIIVNHKKNLLTDAGKDLIHNATWVNASGNPSRGAGFIALSENAGGASASHTSVASEISTNGLARADATTKTHTAASNTSTVQHTFTATGAFTAVQLSGLLNASSAGTLVNENTFTSTALAINDQLQITWTLTAS